MKLFKKIFILTLIFTAATWSMAWVFSAMAGETPKSTIKKLQTRLNDGNLIEEKETLDLQGIEKLHVETRSTDVTIETGDVGVATFTGMGKPGGKIILLERKGNELIVTLDKKHARRGLMWDFGDDANISVTTTLGLKISLPADVIKDLHVLTRSGDIKLRNLKLDSLDLGASSGDVTLLDCSARQLGAVKTSSGDIAITGFDGKLRTSSTSGEIDAQRISGADFESVSTSGDIEIKDVKVSGLRAQATSGDISVALSDGTGWKFSLSATSGEIENDFSDDVKAEKVMQIRSTSGDIRVRR